MRRRDGGSGGARRRATRAARVPRAVSVGGRGRERARPDAQRAEVTPMHRDHLAAGRTDHVVRQDQRLRLDQPHAADARAVDGAGEAVRVLHVRLRAVVAAPAARGAVGVPDGRAAGGGVGGHGAHGRRRVVHVRRRGDASGARAELAARRRAARHEALAVQRDHHAARRGHERRGDGVDARARRHARLHPRHVPLERDGALADRVGAHRAAALVEVERRHERGVVLRVRVRVCACVCAGVGWGVGGGGGRGVCVGRRGVSGRAARRAAEAPLRGA